MQPLDFIITVDNQGIENGSMGAQIASNFRRPIRPALISGFSSIKRIGVFILPPGWDASPSQGYPQHYAGTQLYTWVERGNVRVKCLAQEHNAMSPARPRTRTTRSGVERTNHEATAPPGGGGEGGWGKNQKKKSCKGKCHEKKFTQRRR